MKSSFYFLLFSMFFVIACNNSQSSEQASSDQENTAEAVTEEIVETVAESTWSPTKNIAELATGEKGKFYPNVKSYLDLSHDQTIKLKEIDKDYKQKVKELKDQNQWAGQENNATRVPVKTDYKNKLVELLGEDKYEAFVEFEKTYRSKKS